MKTKPVVLFSLLALAVTTLGLLAQTRPAGLVVHEWGTFTSFQAGDGVPLYWKPLESSKLPAFVHSSANPGANIQYPPLMIFGKGAVTSLQRMETPVIYLYSDSARGQTVDVSVCFPQGSITEWYPQATKLAFASNEPAIEWKGLQVQPPFHTAAGPRLPHDESGSHYFAARATGSDELIMTIQSPTTTVSEHEQFLFYRGIGNFATPLRVTMKSDDAVTLQNTAREALSHLFVMGMTDQSGRFVYVERLAPGEEKTVPLGAESVLARVPFAERIRKAMAQSLTNEGLYDLEATAMVNTWKDSWFAEPGVRVLYVLPRTWTDATLPLQVTPTPRETVRVMVGRSEILPPATERALTLQIGKIRQGDAEAVPALRKSMNSLGRFSDAAFNRALDQATPKPEERAKMVAQIYGVQMPNLK